MVCSNNFPHWKPYKLQTFPGLFMISIYTFPEPLSNSIIMAKSHHRHGQHKTVLSCRWCEQHWRQVKTVFSNPHHILIPGKTVSKFSVADSLDLLPILFTSPTLTRQCCLALCRRRELGIRKRAQHCEPILSPLTQTI